MPSHSNPGEDILFNSAFQIIYHKPALALAFLVLHGYGLGKQKDFTAWMEDSGVCAGPRYQSCERTVLMLIMLDTSSGFFTTTTDKALPYPEKLFSGDFHLRDGFSQEVAALAAQEGQPVLYHPRNMFDQVETRQNYSGKPFPSEAVLVTSYLFNWHQVHKSQGAFECSCSAWANSRNCIRINAADLSKHRAGKQG